MKRVQINIEGQIISVKEFYDNGHTEKKELTKTELKAYVAELFKEKKPDAVVRTKENI